MCSSVLCSSPLPTSCVAPASWCFSSTLRNRNDGHLQEQTTIKVEEKHHEAAATHEAGKGEEHKTEEHKAAGEHH